jgi:hypothetical protein
VPRGHVWHLLLHSPRAPGFAVDRVGNAPEAPDFGRARGVGHGVRLPHLARQPEAAASAPQERRDAAVLQAKGDHRVASGGHPWIGPVSDVTCHRQPRCGYSTLMRVGGTRRGARNGCLMIACFEGAMCCYPVASMRRRPSRAYCAAKPLVITVGRIFPVSRTRAHVYLADKAPSRCGLDQTHPTQLYASFWPVPVARPQHSQDPHSPKIVPAPAVMAKRMRMDA